MRLATLVIVAPLVYVPHILIDRYQLPKLVFVSMLAALCAVKLKSARVWPYSIAAGFYVLFVIASVKNAENLIEWWMQVSLDLSGLAIFYYVVNFISAKDIPRLIERLGFVGIALAVSALFGPWLGLDLALDNGFGGAQGNKSFAAAIQGVALIAWYFTAARPEWWANPVVLIGFVSSGWHIWLTRSLATMLGVVAGVGLILCRRRKALWVVITLAAMLALSHQPLGYSWSGRAETWDAALRAISDFPLFGVGRGQAELILPVYMHYSVTRHHFDPWGNLMRPFDSAVHNDLLQLWMEAGIGAVLSLGGMLYLILSQSASDKTGAALCAMLAVLGVHMAFNFPLELAEQSALFWLLLGLLYVQKNALGRAAS